MITVLCVKKKTLCSEQCDVGGLSELALTAIRQGRPTFDLLKAHAACPVKVAWVSADRAVDFNAQAIGDGAVSATRNGFSVP